MSASQRRKGARGELEVAELLTRAGFPCSRNGRNGITADDLAHSIPGVHLEVKRVERLNVPAAMAQAKRDAGIRSPVVLHRRSRDEWLATVRLEDLLEWWWGPR